MLKSKVLWMMPVAAVLGLAGGMLALARGDEPAARPTAPNVKVSAMPAPKGASITGTVKVEGEVKKRKKIKMDADPKCSAMYAESPLMEDLVVDANGMCQWAFVYVKKGAEGKKPTDPPAEAVINQKGCHYEPHVLGIVVGQDLIVRNSDDLLHNIHALPFSNKEFNFGQPTKGLEEKKQFSTPEIMVKVKCDVHPWMGAWIGVLDHGFFAVSDAAGKFAIPAGLPDGTYTVECWHEKYKSVTSEVQVKGGVGTAAFVLTEKKGD
jgi:hypothetical protein